jgi:hypothetical protein
MWQRWLLLVCLLWEGVWSNIEQQQEEERIDQLEVRIARLEDRIEQLERLIQQEQPLLELMETEEKEHEFEETSPKEDLAVGDTILVPHLNEQLVCSVFADHHCFPSYCDEDSRGRAIEIGSSQCSECAIWNSCPQEGFNCFDGVCLSYLQVMEQILEFGKGCDTHNDCVQACDLGESPKAHYLANFVKKALNKNAVLGRCGPEPQRSPRLPEVDDEGSGYPECSGDGDCTGEDVYCFNHRVGSPNDDKRCMTFKELLEIKFLVGKPCSQRRDCPEECYANTATCGPHLVR